MKFEKYQSLVNESMKNVGGFLRNSEVMASPAVVTEKIHGANFSVYLKKGAINFASRSQMLCPETNFMNCQRYFTPEKVKALVEFWDSLPVSDNSELRFIGEIYGGLDIAGIKPVQREVHYSGDISFKVFQIQVVGMSQQEEEEVYNYNWDSIETLCGNFGLETVPVIAKGVTFEEAYKLSTAVNSLLSDKEDNLCEGFCIRIENPVVGAEPLVFKKRNTDFLESKGTVKAVQNTAEQTQLGMEAMARLGSFVTPQRVSNVNSHHGYQSLKDFSNLMLMVIEDVLNEYKAEYDVDLRNEPVWKEIKRSFGNQLVPLIRAELA